MTTTTGTIASVYAEPQHAGPAHARAHHVRRPVTPVLPYTLLALLSFACVGAVLFAEPRLRLVLAPALTMVWLSCLYLAVLITRDRVLPLFEVATYWVAATTLYGVFPLVNFIAGGLEWGLWSNSRLILLTPGPAEVGAMGWRYATYLGSFVLLYLPLRGRAAVLTTKLDSPGFHRAFAIILCLAGLSAAMIAIGEIYGVVFYASYRDKITGAVQVYQSLPLGILQFVQNGVAIRLIMAQFVIILLLRNWKHYSARIVLVGSLLAAGGLTFWLGGARTDFVLLCLATVMLYHRLVRPITLRLAVPGGALLLFVFLAMGYIRDVQGTLSRNLSIDDIPPLAAPNEFQVVFATGYHLVTMRDSGELKNVPMQIHWADFTALIPGQFLPFRKINPSVWYLEVAGLAHSGVGYMFGAVAQSVVGWDWIELALRGLGVALFCAAVQRWYARHPTSFWRTAFCMFVGIWMYYSSRQVSFSFLYFIVYRFIPAMLLVEAVRYPLLATQRRLRPKKAATGQAAVSQ